MKIGIVGSESKKFTPETEQKAREIIKDLISPEYCTAVISGRCHLGGIDIWAVEEARKLGVDTVEFPPVIKTWEGGYKARNIKIAEHSDIVYCITIKHLPDSYSGMKFSHCYHCGTNDHVKSGGCWTVKYTKKLGKEGKVIVIE